MANLLATSTPSITGTTCLQTPIVKTSCILNEGGTAVMRFASGFAQACTCLSSPIVCGTNYVKGVNVYGTSFIWTVVFYSILVFTSTRSNKA